MNLVLLDQPLELKLYGREALESSQFLLQEAPLAAVGYAHQTGQLILMPCLALLCLPDFFGSIKSDQLYLKSFIYDQDKKKLQINVSPRYLPPYMEPPFNIRPCIVVPSTIPYRHTSSGCLCRGLHQTQKENY